MSTLADVIRWLEESPDGTMLPARAVLSLIRDASPAPEPATPDVAAPALSAGWQERLWTVPADTRMTVGDVSEALSRPKSWVYRHTSQASGMVLLPHRKLDGELLFTAGELRDWINAHETVVVASPKVTPIDRGRRGRNLTPAPIRAISDRS